MCVCLCVCVYKKYERKTINVCERKTQTWVWVCLAYKYDRKTIYIISHSAKTIAQSAGAVEYTHCTSAKGSVPPQWVSKYDTKQSDGEVPVMLELWGMWSTPSLLSLPGPLWPGEVEPDWALSRGWIEVNCILMLNWIFWIDTVWLDWIAWNRNVFDN